MQVYTEPLPYEVAASVALIAEPAAQGTSLLHLIGALMVGGILGAYAVLLLFLHFGAPVGGDDAFGQGSPERDRVDA